MDKLGQGLLLSRNLNNFEIFIRETADGNIF
jgi:hypothetical protein